MIINKEKGFTLIEIAIVMVIIGLLTGGGISMMRVLSERKLRNENIEYLKQAKEAVISFGTINGFLPLMDTNADGRGDSSTTPGTLPFLDLSLPPTDPYGRVLKYVANSNLINNRQSTCNKLMTGFNPNENPEVVDAEGSTIAFSVAAILISNGPKTPFDAVAGAYSGNNNTGSPYIKSFLTSTFDDEVIYIGGFELYGKNCGNSTTVSINNTSASPVDIYIRRIAPAPAAGEGVIVLKGEIKTCSFIPGTQVGIYNYTLGSPPTVGLLRTSVIAAGEGLVITIP